MTKAPDRYGLIILGNSGVGKSFLANILLGRDAFKHEPNCAAVTTKTEYHEVTFIGVKYAIFNIPGLIESKQEMIDTNKQEIGKAFTECPNAVIIYVFGNQNGRIRSEDVIAFNALNAAYPFKNTSLVLVVNCQPAPSKRPVNYSGETIVLLQERLDLKEWENICFLDDITTENESAGKQKLREELLPSILASIPNHHDKKHDIILQADQIATLKQDYDNLAQKSREQQTASEKANKEETDRRHEAEEKYKRERRKRHRANEDLKQAQEKQKAEQKEQKPEQEEQKPGATDATNSSALQRGLATATTAALAAAPFGPLVAGLTAAAGFAAGYNNRN